MLARAFCCPEDQLLIRVPHRPVSKRKHFTSLTRLKEFLHLLEYGSVTVKTATYLQKISEVERSHGSGSKFP